MRRHVQPVTQARMQLVRLGCAINPFWERCPRESAPNVGLLERPEARRAQTMCVSRTLSARTKIVGRPDARGNLKFDDERRRARCRSRLATPTGRGRCNLPRVRAPLPYCCWLPASLVSIASRALAPLVWPGRRTRTARWRAQQSCAARLLRATRGQLVSAAPVPLYTVVLSRARVPNPRSHRSAVGTHHFTRCGSRRSGRATLCLGIAWVSLHSAVGSWDFRRAWVEVRGCSFTISHAVSSTAVRRRIAVLITAWPQSLVGCCCRFARA